MIDVGKGRGNLSLLIAGLSTMRPVFLKPYVFGAMFALLCFGSANADMQLVQRVLRDMRNTPGISDLKAHDDKTIRYSAHGLQGQLNLGNLIAEMADAKTADKEAIYHHFINVYQRSITRMGREASAPDPNRLILIVRNQDFLKPTIGKDAVPEGSRFAAITPSLNVLIAEKIDGFIATVGSETLAKANLNRDQAESTALTNLDRLAAEAKIEQIRDLLVWYTRTDEETESSLILSQAFLARATATARGPILIGVPERGMLLFARASEPTAVSVLEHGVRKLHSEALGNRQLSLDILYSDGGPVRAR